MLEKSSESNLLFEINNSSIPYSIMESAIYIRECELLLLELVKSGEIGGTIHTCVGQELPPIVISKHLSEQDYVFSNHRGHGHYLARTNDYRGLISEVMGMKSGSSGGIGGSQHLYSNRYLSNGVQGGMIPVATGCAFSSVYKSENAISVVYIGDGTFGEGVLYESINIASLWNLPLLIVVENNCISQSTSILQSLAGTIKDRAEAFNLRYYTCDGNNYKSIIDVIPGVVDEVRKLKAPALLEVKSYRLLAHSKGDDNRDPNYIAALAQADTINIFKEKYIDDYNKIRGASHQFLKNIIADLKNDSVGELIFEKANKEVQIDYQDYYPNINGNIYNHEIYQSLKLLMENEDDVVLLGEDIEDSNEFNPGSYGGAFKVTKDLSSLYKGRVLNTPISEAAITGISTGIAFSGMRPILEIMFGDFTTLILDQILQHSSKFVTMYGRVLPIPLVIRTPMGGGRGYGPTHSQSIEKHFLGIPNLDIIAINHRIEPSKVYFDIIRNTQRPLLIIENKKVYTQRIDNFRSTIYKYLISNEIFPTLRLISVIENIQPSVTIICYGGILIEIEQILDDLFYEHEILCDIIIPSNISGTNIEVIADSLKKTGNLLSIEEGSNIASWSNFVVSRLIENYNVEFSLKSLGNNSVIPASKNLENDTLINRDKIYNSIIEIANGK